MSTAIHVINSEQELPISIDEAWEFFSTPANLEKLTPKSLRFKILTCSHDTMVEGQIISYKIRLMPLVWMNWVTEIKQVEDKHFFVDDQRSGPYKIWHHRHTFTETENGVLMQDQVHYLLPFGFIGKIVHTLFVKAQLKRIFSYRTEMLAERFGG
ncbi:MAG: ligand-binding SRPBCC domain-containing protein [Cryomorphaceae bacterium]|jgi:ligand-binding SRPBCC domain-containing protein